MPKNEHGQAIGFPLTNWATPAFPVRQDMQGEHCKLEPLNPAKHAEDLFAANAVDKKGIMWTYMSYGPFETMIDYKNWMLTTSEAKDPQFYAILDLKTAKAVGVASYLRIDPTAGAIEVGHIAYSPLLQTRTLATEAMYLMMNNAFQLGYRRYEWKCDALNEKSRKAALRLGFTYEGTFRQATHYKNRNRDTAWFSVIDSEWSAVKSTFETWLDKSNFDEQGQQLQSLSTLRASATH